MPYSIHLPIHPSVHLSVYPSTHPNTHPPICQSIHSYTHPFIHSSVYPSAHHPPTYPFMNPHTCPSIHPLIIYSSTIHPILSIFYIWGPMLFLYDQSWSCLNLQINQASPLIIFSLGLLLVLLRTHSAFCLHSVIFCVGELFRRRLCVCSICSHTQPDKQAQCLFAKGGVLVLELCHRIRSKGLQL